MNRELLRTNLTKSRHDVVVMLEGWRRRDLWFNLGWSAFFAFATFICAAMSFWDVLTGEYLAAAVQAGAALINLWGVHRNLVVAPEKDRKFYHEMEGYIAHYDAMLKTLDEEEQQDKK